MAALNMTEPLSGIYVKHRRLTKIREIECVTSKPMEREKKKNDLEKS